MTTTATAPCFKAIAPVLTVPDVGAAIAFYRDSFGFTVGHTADEPPMYATLHRDGVDLHLCRGERASGGCYLTLEGVDALYQQLVAAGADIARPIENAPHGMRDFVVRDPAGNEVQVGEPITPRG